MRRNFWIQVQNYMRKAKFRRKVRNILAMLAVVTVFTTTYALILPAITLENSVPLAGFDANEGKTPEELAAEAERQAAAEAAAAEGSGNGGVDADPASFVGTADSTGEGGQNPAAAGETPPPTPPDSVEVSGEVSGEFSSDKTDYPSIEGFTMNVEGRVFDASGNEIDPTKLSEAQRQSLLADLHKRTANEALANYHMNGAGQVLDANEQPVDTSGLSPETLKALEQKYIDEVLSLYHMDKDGTILDSLNQPQDPATFSAAAIVALREKSRSDASVSAGEDSEKEPGSHDLSLYKMQDNGRIVSEDGAEIPAERFSEEELASLKKAWSERVLAEYSIDENGDVKNAEGETVDSSAFPEELLLALRQKAADGSEALPYALKMYMDQDLVIKDGFTHQPVSEEKLNELSAKLRDILYGFEVNYDARLEVKDRYTAGLRAQGLDAQAESVASSAAPMAEAGRQQTLAANARQIAAGEAALDAEVQAELAQVKEQAASAEGGQGDSLPIDLDSLNSQANADSQTDADSQTGAESLARSAQDSQDSEPITLEDLAGQQALGSAQGSQQALGSAPQSAPSKSRSSAPAQAPTRGAGQQPNLAPINPPAPDGLDSDNNTLTQNPPQPYYYYANPADPHNSGFIRVAVDTFVGQNVEGHTYNFPTGYLAKIKFAFSTQGSEFNQKHFRIYLKADKANPGEDNYTEPGTLTILGTGGNPDLTFKVKSVVNNPGPGVLYYYDIQGLPVGSTGLANTYLNYKNGSLGGNTTIWAESISDPSLEPAYSLMPTSSYMNIPHVVEPRDQQVTKRAMRSPGFNKSTEDNQYYVNGLSFSVYDVISGNREFFDEFGELYYRHTKEQPDIAKDILSLPDGLKFRADDLGQVETIHVTYQSSELQTIQGVPQKLNMPGTMLVANSGGQRYMLAYMEETRSSELYYAYEARLENGKLVITAKAWYKNPQKPDRLPLWTYSNPLNYQIGERLIQFKEAPGENGPEQDIVNRAEYTLHRLDDQEQSSNCEVTVVLKPKAAHLTIKKTKDPGKVPKYFGEKAGWNISVKNDSTFVYKNLETLIDELDPNIYISWDDLYQLFTAPKAFEGQGDPVVTISKGTLVATPQGTVANAIGDGVLNKDAQYHGVDTPYDGLAQQDPDEKAKNRTLTITREGGNLKIAVTLPPNTAEETSTMIPLADLKGKSTRGSFDFPNGQSYIVTHWSQYKISWPYQKNQQNYTFQGGEEHKYSVPTTVKDSFMLLEADRKNYYPDEQLRVSNSAKGAFNTTDTADHTVDNREAKHDNAIREASIFKGQEQGDTASGVSSFIVIAQHKGQGAPEVLTITDHVKQDFVQLLVLTSDNLGRNLTTTNIPQGYGAVTEPGKYYFRTMDGTKILGEVTKRDDNTWLIKWHFNRDTVVKGFDQTIRVFTYVDPTDRQHASNAYVNETWMNDHATHRLYDSVQKSPLYDFNKKIVTRKHAKNSFSSPQNDEVTDFTRLAKGQTVLYRLELWGTSGVNLSKKNIFDRLPETPEGFLWNNSNVRIVDTVSFPEYCVTFNNIKNISITPNKPDGKHQELHWTEEGDLIKFGDLKPSSTAYIYVELDYPGDDATWKKYQNEYGRTGIDNFFHVYEGEKSVHHSLASSQICQLDKSLIYSNIVHDYNNSKVLSPYNTDPYSYWNSPYYASLSETSESWRNWGDKTSFLVYTISLTNPSNDNLYLSDIHDTLPSGFKFSGFVRGVFFYTRGEAIEGYDAREYTDERRMTREDRDTDNLVSRISYQGEPYVYVLNTGYNGAYTELPVHSDDIKYYTIKQTSADPNQPVFRISDIVDQPFESGSSVTKEFKDAHGWYLPPQSALTFAYRVIVDKYDETPAIATNKASMAYTKVYPDMEPELPAEGDVKVEVSWDRLSIDAENMPVNQGSHDLTKDVNDNFVLSSEVTVKREATQIGIKKTFTGATRDGQSTDLPQGDASPTDIDGYYKPVEQLNWSVDLPVQSGVVQDWSLTETMEDPYGFDEVKFYPQRIYRKTDMPKNGQADAPLYYLFTFKTKPDGTIKVTLKRPPIHGIELPPVHNSITSITEFYDANGTFNTYKEETKTISPPGNNTVTFGNGPSVFTPDFTVTIVKDAKGNQKLTITPEAGYFGYSHGLKHYKIRASGDMEVTPLDQEFPKFEIKTSNHSIETAKPKLYRNTAQLTPTVPIMTAPIAGRYESGSVIDGANAPVFGDRGTMSNKSVTELDVNYQPKLTNNEPNMAEGNPLNFKSTERKPQVISLPNSQTPLLYTLKLKNLSSNKTDTGKIDDLILIDNLPQAQDTKTWDPTAPRSSKFQINLADQSIHKMKVQVQDYDELGIAQGNPRELKPNEDYVIEYSDEVAFAADDFQNRPSSNWYDTPKESTRSFRFRTKSDSDKAKISAYAVVELQYYAVVDSDFKPSKDDQIAWNSFGYSYHLPVMGEGVYLSSEPDPVGVKLPGLAIPSIQKQRFYKNNEYPVDPSEPTAPDGQTGDQLSYLFLVLNEGSQSENPQYDHDNTQGKAFVHLGNALKSGSLNLTDLTGKTLDQLNARLLQAMGEGNNGQYTQTANSYQLYRVPLAVGASSGLVPMVAEIDPNTHKNIGLTIVQKSSYVVLELLNPQTGKPYVVKADGKIYEDEVTEPQAQCFTDNQGGSLQRQFLTTSNGNYPVYTWTPNQKINNLDLAKLTLTATNEGKSWNINVRKTDGSEEPVDAAGGAETQPKALLGAVFGLYSPLETEAMNDTTVEVLQRQYKFTDRLTRSYSDPNGHTYFLKAVVDSPELGVAQPFTPTGKIYTGDHTGWKDARAGTLATTARFEDLHANEYVLRELRAPAGYKCSTAPIYLKRSTYYADAAVKLPGPKSATGSAVPSADNNDAWALVSNEIEFVELLPETGGIGRWPFILGGLFFLLVAGAGLWARRRQAAPEAAPQSRR